MVVVILIVPLVAGQLFELGNVTHIVVGSAEGFMLLVNGYVGIGWTLFGFAVPTLLGNIIGGTAIFAVIAYAHVMKEI